MNLYGLNKKKLFEEKKRFKRNKQINKQINKERLVILPLHCCYCDRSNNNCYEVEKPMCYNKFDRSPRVNKSFKKNDNKVLRNFMGNIYGVSLYFGNLQKKVSNFAKNFFGQSFLALSLTTAVYGWRKISFEQNKKFCSNLVF